VRPAPAFADSPLEYGFRNGSWKDRFVSASEACLFYDNHCGWFADHIYRIAPRPDFEALIDQEQKIMEKLREWECEQRQEHVAAGFRR
jgi:hypothetical protein